jgi:YHS domain-containing protein
MAEMEKKHEHDHSTHSMEKEGTSDKARCAYAGMMMKKSAMIAMEHGDETLYFCNKEQMDAFHKSPKRYLKKVNIGHTPLMMNVLTMKEYKDMMESMGMGKMMKKPGANDTHWLSVYLAGEHEAEIPGFAVKVVSPKGKTELKELKYDKMMKTYAGNVSLLESGKYKLSLLMESPAVTLP